MSRYDRYDAFAPRAGAGPYGWYPGAFWGGVPMFGWGAWGGAWGWPPYAPVGYGAYGGDYTPRRPPEQSPSYGRGGDRAVRDWAAREGYDAGFSIRPHRARPRGRARRYDRGW